MLLGSQTVCRISPNFGANYIKVVALKPVLSATKAYRRIQFSTINDLWWYCQKLLKKNA